MKVNDHPMFTPWIEQFPDCFIRSLVGSTGRIISCNIIDADEMKLLQLDPTIALDIRTFRKPTRFKTIGQQSS